MHVHRGLRALLIDITKVSDFLLLWENQMTSNTVSIDHDTKTSNSGQHDEYEALNFAPGKPDFKHPV